MEDVDAVMKYSLGFRYAALGPFEVADFGGLDIFYHISEYLSPDLSRAEQPQKLIADCYAAGGLWRQDRKRLLRLFRWKR